MIHGRHFRQARVFTKGPFRRFGPVFDLEPANLSGGGAGGSKVSYALEWEPLTLVGRLFGARLAAQAGEVVGKRILEAVAFAKGSRAKFIPTWPRPAPRQRQRGGGARRRDRPQPLRQRPRPHAGRPPDSTAMATLIFCRSSPSPWRAS